MSTDLAHICEWYQENTIIIHKVVLYFDQRNVGDWTFS